MRAKNHALLQRTTCLSIVAISHINGNIKCQLKEIRRTLKTIYQSKLACSTRHRNWL